MSARRAVALLGAALLGLGVPPARAQDRGEQPTRFELSATGTLMAGNVRQVLGQGRAHLSRSTARGGYDAIASAFRLWVRPLPGDPLLRVGDDLSLMALPFVYLGEKPYLLGTARAERTAIRGVNGRLNGGVAAGIAPVRRADRLLRVALGLQAEATAFAAPELAPAWVEDGDRRVVPRATVQANGWMKAGEGPLSARFVGSVLVNPLEPRDTRGFVDASADVRLRGAVSARLAVGVIHDAVVPVGVQPTDLRGTVGVAWTAPRPP